MTVKVTRKDNTPLDVGDANNGTLLYLIIKQLDNIADVVIKGATFSDIGLSELLIKDVRFVDCVFTDVQIWPTTFMENVVLEHCRIKGPDDWTKRKGVTLINCSINVPPSNEDIEKIVCGKVFSLPNKDYVKVEAECDFCHNKFYEIMSRKRVRPMLKSVPQCDKRVCDQCYKNYELESKIKENRTYGWHGSLSFYRTPMDAKNTEILGLEMEFEGDFWGWKGLQDAHRGHLHYGYDSSVRGENELSWDCGSYSYWKYLAPLEDVCNAVKNGGGSTGDTAGIHIHVSSPDSNVRQVTHIINEYCQCGVFRTLMEAVSMRSDRERFDKYANLALVETVHHAGISYNGHNTCEFRVFNSCLDHKIILRNLKFCKEIYHLVKTKTPKERILPSLSKETKAHIIACAKAQINTGFITESEGLELIKALGD